MTDYELFGEKFHEKVRKLIKTDEAFLPDRIIEADLHTENVRNLMASLMELIVRYEIIVTVQQIRKIEGVARLYLAGSICLALQSRAMDKQFEKYRPIGWRAKSQSLTFQANADFNRLYVEIGGEDLKNEEKIAFQQFAGFARR